MVREKRRSVRRVIPRRSVMFVDTVNAAGIIRVLIGPGVLFGRSRDDRAETDLAHRGAAVDARAPRRPRPPGMPSLLRPAGRRRASQEVEKYRDDDDSRGVSHVHLKWAGRNSIDAARDASRAAVPSLLLSLLHVQPQRTARIEDVARVEVFLDRLEHPEGHRTHVVLVPGGKELADPVVVREAAAGL
jgi:hypothetical protein